MDGGEALSHEVMLRFRAGGGEPPPSHEVLVVEPGGTAWYLAGMPWPQRPADEVGTYRVQLDEAALQGLHELARQAVAEEPRVLEMPDAGTERVTVAGASARWSPDDRPAAGGRLAEAVRRVIDAARASPWSAVRGELRGPELRLEARGERPLLLAGGDVRAGESDSPLDLAAEAPVPLVLPAELAPGERLALGVPEAAHALVRLRLASPVPGEPSWVDGRLVAGRPVRLRPRASAARR